MNPALSSIPLNRTLAAQFLGALVSASDREVEHVRRLINTLPEVSLDSFVTNVVSVCFEERFLRLVCESKEIGERIQPQTLSRLISMIASKTRRNYLDQAIFDELSTSLLSNYNGHNGASFLPRVLNALEDTENFQMLSLTAFDKALAEHVRLTPGQDLEQIRHSWNALQAWELPRTLDAFCAQLIAEGKFNSVERFTVNSYTSSSLHSSYVTLLRRCLGDDVLSGICAGAHMVSESFSSAAKIIPWTGEAAFHTEHLLSKLEIRLASKTDSTTQYILDFVRAGADEATFPILADFVIENIQAILRKIGLSNKYECALGLMGLAKRKGFDEDAMRFLLSEIIKMSFSSVDRERATTASDVVNFAFDMQIKNFPQGFWAPERDLILKAIAIIGLEVAQKVVPEARGGLINGLLETMGSEVSKASLLKMFPKAKASFLEMEMGI
jgi:hypothetical protein